MNTVAKSALTAAFVLGTIGSASAAVVLRPDSDNRAGELQAAVFGDGINDDPKDDGYNIDPGDVFLPYSTTLEVPFLEYSPDAMANAELSTSSEWINYDGSGPFECDGIRFSSRVAAGAEAFEDLGASAMARDFVRMGLLIEEDSARRQPLFLRLRGMTATEGAGSAVVELTLPGGSMQQFTGNFDTIIEVTQSGQLFLNGLTSIDVTSEYRLNAGLAAAKAELTVVPEPAAFALLVCGAFGLVRSR